MAQHLRNHEPDKDFDRSPPAAWGSFITRPFPTLVLVSLFAATIYSNTFYSSFHFDDSHTIINNFQLRNLGNFIDFSGSRYIGYLSFALNYHFGKLNVFGYHVINLTIHILNGLLSYN